MKFKHVHKHEIYFVVTESGDSYMCEDGVWYEADVWKEWERIIDEKFISELNAALQALEDLTNEI